MGLVLCFAWQTTAIIFVALVVHVFLCVLVCVCVFLVVVVVNILKYKILQPENPASGLGKNGVKTQMLIEASCKQLDTKLYTNSSVTRE